MTARKRGVVEQVDADGFRRRIEFVSAHDKRNGDPKKNYGIHGVELRLVLIGPRGATQLVIFTNWQVAKVRAEMLDDERSHRPMHSVLYRPMPADVGFHAPVAQYAGQTSQDACEYLGGRPCFYDGSSLEAERVFDVFTDQGLDAVWKILRERHDKILLVTPSEDA